MITLINQLINYSYKLPLQFNQLNTQQPIQLINNEELIKC